MGSLGLTVAVGADPRTVANRMLEWRGIPTDSPRFFWHVDVVFECPGFAHKTFVDYDK